MEWTKTAQNRKYLATLVKKDRNGEPHEGDINIAYNMLGEIRKRAQLRIDLLKKADKYLSDITEYQGTLEKRGIFFEKKEEPVAVPAEKAAPAPKKIKDSSK